MAGNEWPPFAGLEGGEMPRMSLPSTDLGNAKEEEEIKYHASSLNSAYQQLREGGLVVVTDDFNKLSRGPKMEVYQGEKLLGNWGLIKAAVKKPARGVIREGVNCPAKSLSGPISPSSLIPLDNVSSPGAAVVTSCKRRRRQKLTRAKVEQFSNRSLFKGEGRKRRRKRGKRTKKSKVGKDAREKSDGEKDVCSKKRQKKRRVPRSSQEQKSEASKDFDLDAKVGEL